MKFFMHPQRSGQLYSTTRGGNVDINNISKKEKKPRQISNFVFLLSSSSYCLKQVGGLQEVTANSGVKKWIERESLFSFIAFHQTTRHRSKKNVVMGPTRHACPAGLVLHVRR